MVFPSGPSQTVKSMTVIFMFYYRFTTWQLLTTVTATTSQRIERTSAERCPGLYSVPVYIQFLSI